MVSIDAAENFLWLNARLLERRRFEHLFRDGEPRRVVDALRPYNNPDGGFGHGLEPDLRGPDSQPVPVDVALFVLHETGRGDSDMLPGILDWLTDVSGPDGGVQSRTGANERRNARSGSSRTAVSRARTGSGADHWAIRPMRRDLRTIIRVRRRRVRSYSSGPLSASTTASSMAWQAP